MVARALAGDETLSDLFLRILNRQEEQIKTLARLDTTVEGLVKAVDKLSGIEVRVQIIEHDQEKALSQREKLIAYVSAGVASISACFTILGHFIWAR